MASGPTVHAFMLTQSYLTLCNPMDCSRLASSVHGIFQARIGCHLLKSGPGNRGRLACGTTHVARLEFPRETGLILRDRTALPSPFHTPTPQFPLCALEMGKL